MDQDEAMEEGENLELSSEHTEDNEVEMTSEGESPRKQEWHGSSGGGGPLHQLPPSFSSHRHLLLGSGEPIAMDDELNYDEDEEEEVVEEGGLAEYAYDGRGGERESPQTKVSSQQKGWGADKNRDGHQHAGASDKVYHHTESEDRTTPISGDEGEEQEGHRGIPLAEKRGPRRKEGEEEEGEVSDEDSENHAVGEVPGGRASSNGESTAKAAKIQKPHRSAEVLEEGELTESEDSDDEVAVIRDGSGFSPKPVSHLAEDAVQPQQRRQAVIRGGERSRQAILPPSEAGELGAVESYSQGPTGAGYSRQHLAIVCKFHLRGECNWGDNCKYYHPPEPERSRLRLKYQQRSLLVGNAATTYHTSGNSSSYNNSRNSTSGMPQPLFPSIRAAAAATVSRISHRTGTTIPSLLSGSIDSPFTPLASSPSRRGTTRPGSAAVPISVEASAWERGLKQARELVTRRNSQLNKSSTEDSSSLAAEMDGQEKLSEGDGRTSGGAKEGSGSGRRLRSQVIRVDNSVQQQHSEQEGFERRRSSRDEMDPVNDVARRRSRSRGGRSSPPPRERRSSGRHHQQQYREPQYSSRYHHQSPDRAERVSSSSPSPLSNKANEEGGGGSEAATRRRSRSRSPLRRGYEGGGRGGGRSIGPPYRERSPWRGQQRNRRSRSPIRNSRYSSDSRDGQWGDKGIAGRNREPYRGTAQPRRDEREHERGGRTHGQNASPVRGRRTEGESGGDTRRSSRDHSDQHHHHYVTTTQSSGSEQQRSAGRDSQRDGRHARRGGGGGDNSDRELSVNATTLGSLLHNASGNSSGVWEKRQHSERVSSRFPLNAGIDEDEEDDENHEGGRKRKRIYDWDKEGDAPAAYNRSGSGLAGRDDPAEQQSSTSALSELRESLRRKRRRHQHSDDDEDEGEKGSAGGGKARKGKDGRRNSSDSSSSNEELGEDSRSSSSASSELLKRRGQGRQGGRGAAASGGAMSGAAESAVSKGREGAEEQFAWNSKGQGCTPVGSGPSSPGVNYSPTIGDEAGNAELGEEGGGLMSNAMEEELGAEQTKEVEKRGMPKTPPTPALGISDPSEPPDNEEEEDEGASDESSDDEQPPPPPSPPPPPPSPPKVGKSGRRSKEELLRELHQVEQAIKQKKKELSGTPTTPSSSMAKNGGGEEE